MSVNLGLPYAEGEQSSNARRNATSVISADGDVVAAFPPSMKIPYFRVLSDGGGLKKDENYFRSADELSLINFRRKHKHSTNTDEEGGLYHDILVNNLRVLQFGWHQPFNKLDDWVVTKSGAAALTELTNATVGRYQQLNSTWSGSAGEYINCRVYSNHPTGFSEMMLAIAKVQMEYNANLVARMGFGMEEVNATIDTLRKVGIEGCNGTGVNWQAVTGSGDARTATPTTMDMAPSQAFRALRIFYNPYTAEVKISNSDGGYKLVTSTVPSGGQIDPQRCWNHGIVTTNSTVKKMWTAHVAFIAKNIDPAWFDVPFGDNET